MFPSNCADRIWCTFWYILSDHSIWPPKIDTFTIHHEICVRCGWIEHEASYYLLLLQDGHFGNLNFFVGYFWYRRMRKTRSVLGMWHVEPCYSTLPRRRSLLLFWTQGSRTTKGPKHAALDIDWMVNFLNISPALHFFLISFGKFTRQLPIYKADRWLPKQQSKKTHPLRRCISVSLSIWFAFFFVK